MSNKPVIIVGAGLAGLAAGLELHQAGRPVIVLEARSRVGGRVYTLRGFGDGRVAEAGGEFINSEHRRMRTLVKQFGLTLEVVPGMDEWFSWLALEGKIGAADDVSVWGVRLNEEVAKIDKALTKLGKIVSDPANPQSMVGAAELDSMTVREWLESLDVHPLARKGFAARLRAEFLVEPDGHSTLDLARWGSLAEMDGAGGPTYHIKGGNDQLTQAMAAALPDVRLNSRVTAVRRGGSGLVVDVEMGGRTSEVEAERVLLAVPLNVLSSIKFEPPLSRPFKQALSDVALGPVTKVILEYERPFWQDVGWTGLLLTDRPLNCIWTTAGGQVGNGGMLTVYTGGKPAANYSKLSDQERISAVVSQIEKFFPGSSNYLTSSRTMAWINERFTQGGYAFFPPGSVTSHWQTLRQPDGRIHFAGEHTAVYQGYMEGAIESGRRAAAEVLLGN